MKTNLEIAAELIAADIRNLNNIEEYCGEPDFTEQDAIDRAMLSSIVGDLLEILHRRQDRQRREWENSQFSLTPPGPRFNKKFT